MSTKGIILLIAALFAFQASGDGEAEKSQWETLQKLMHDMIEKLKEVGDDISEHVEEWAKHEEQRINDFRANMSALIDKEIAELKKKAEEIGVDISECFKELPNGGMDIAKNITQGAIKCVTDEVDEAKSIISTLVELAKEGEATLEDAQAQWEKCKSETARWKVLACQGKVVVTTGFKEGNYSIAGMNQITKGTNLINTARTVMETCVAADLASAPLKMAGLMQNLVECVMEAEEAELNEE